MSEKRTRKPTAYERSFYGDAYRPRLNHPPMFHPSKPLAPQVEAYRRECGLVNEPDESVSDETED